MVISEGTGSGCSDRRSRNDVAPLWPPEGECDDVRAKSRGARRIVDQLDLARARRPGLEVECINVDFPMWMVQSLDWEARRRGVSRQSLIKLWLAERLEQAD